MFLPTTGVTRGTPRDSTSNYEQFIYMAFFCKISKLHEKYFSGKKVVEKLQSAAVAISLRPRAGKNILVSGTKTNLGKISA